MPRKQIKKDEDRLLFALACGATVEAASKQLGLSTRTIYRRMAEPDFRQELSRIRGEMVSRTTGMLTAASLESVKTLLDLQKSSPPAVRLGAAKAVIEIAAKLREVVDLEASVLALQEKVAEITQARSGN